jgi:hypothetical protein
MDTLDTALVESAVRGDRSALAALFVRRRNTERWWTHDHGRSIGEIAETVGIPAGTIKTRMHHARIRTAKPLE